MIWNPSSPLHRAQSARVPLQSFGQRGLSLLYSLLALAALSFAAVALIRSVDTSTMVLGNLGFKQDATAAGDQATRAALQWLAANPSLLTADSPDNGYYASSLGNLDVTGSQSKLSTRALINWNGDGCAYAAQNSFATGGCVTTPSDALAVGENTARYVILRLCSDAGAPDTMTPSGGVNTCVKTMTAGTTSGGENGALDYKRQRLPPSSSSLNYRIIVRVDGARNTVSYTETIVHF